MKEAKHAMRAHKVSKISKAVRTEAKFGGSKISGTKF